MSVFSTSRPVNIQAIMEEMARTQSERQVNMELLKSQKALEAVEAKKQSQLIAQDKKQKEDEERASALEKMKQKRRVDQSKKAVAEAVAFMPGIARQQIIKKAILDIVVESLWVDDAVKNTEANKKEASSVFDNLLQKCCTATGQDLFSTMKNSRWLSCLDDIATECGKAASDRIISEASEAEEIEINFSLKSDEAEEIDKKVASLGSKEISNVIKKKVLNVIKDEKESGKVKAELFKELDEAGKDDEEQESGTTDGIVESLIGQSLEATLETVMSNIDVTFESVVDSVCLLTKTADREVVAKNFDKAIGCYGKSKSLLCDILARSNAQEKEKLDYAIRNISSTMNDRMFQIAPGTRKVTRREANANTFDDVKLDRLIGSAIAYCDGVSDGCKTRKIMTETMDELKQRLIRESVNRTLTNSIGSTVFESLMMANSFKLEKNSSTIMESGTNVSMLESEKQNAALLQTILEYTVLETLNTLKVFKFDRDLVLKIKSM